MVFRESYGFIGSKIIAIVANFNFGIWTCTGQQLQWVCICFFLFLSYHISLAPPNIHLVSFLVCCNETDCFSQIINSG